MEQIEHYLQGNLTEDQALELWKEMLLDQEKLEILEMYLMLRVYHENNRGSHKKGVSGLEKQSDLPT